MTAILLVASCSDEGPIVIDFSNLVWEDDFEGPAGQLPDPNRWSFDTGTNWGNNQLEYDTDRPENASLDGAGHLVITAREESYQGQPYTSARIVTRDLFEPTYGLFEARIQLPVGRGIWPAYWLLGADFETVSWPACGEIDIMEYIGHIPNVVYATVHGPGYSGGGGISDHYTLANGTFDEGFHIFSVSWTVGNISWYVDGNHVFSVTPGDLPGEWVFDHPFYIILNLAVGGNWPGAPDENTVFPQTMLIDWVRVYQ
ncbi:glycoside hydrolase family 16 protein [bacterium]|nr:glycoside hydrolase family 16 protein [bacterium]